MRAFLQEFVVCLLVPCVLGQIGSLPVAVEARNITLPAGSSAVLPCRSQSIVWRQDSLRDRQRVVHWDVFRSEGVERVIDLFPGGDERLYSAFNKGRVTISKTAFSDGNFSLVINNVSGTDRGVYTCNLHHHYCRVQQAVQMQLNVTKSSRKEKRIWDGEKTVFVVLAGKSVVLPCVNRRPLWMEGNQEGQQQVVHWDLQRPGVRRDGAERLVDLYASGENRKYGPLFLSNKMNIAPDAFTLGDFSLSISDLQESEKGLYSCHLHHHYCGLHERRIFRLIVSGVPVITSEPFNSGQVDVIGDQEQFDDTIVDTVSVPRIYNVIVPESRSHFLKQLGYVLGFVLLLALIILAALLVRCHRHKRRELQYGLQCFESHRAAIELQDTRPKNCNREDLMLDEVPVRYYKNNIMKEQAEMSCASTTTDFKTEMEQMFCK
ncbi:matrix remodeling-associated protein 8-like isoform X2 [Denticeps clupeoides]|uniref:matrix remodeling-associated protein 8-like isoform X2 n=1 Tax=Denticeps clupeoides TaxID=299321 RepID=UPI0010A3516F|nr:matrix remodeling-associated protein 8-like isoform X2 [Denticeps clupeoides]